MNKRDVCSIESVRYWMKLCTGHGNQFKCSSIYGDFILIYIQPDAGLHSLFYLETDLHVSGGTSTHHQERKQLCLQYLVFVTPYCYLPLSWKSWNLSECAVGGVRHPQHTQTGSSSSTIAAGSSKGVTNTRYCRHSCLRSWWWVEVPLETCRSVSR